MHDAVAKGNMTLDPPVHRVRAVRIKRCQHAFKRIRGGTAIQVPKAGNRSHLLASLKCALDDAGCDQPREHGLNVLLGYLGGHRIARTCVGDHGLE